MPIPILCGTVLMLVGFGTLAGCSREELAKDSHFEHDHEVAPHWPSDLADAAMKIRQRLPSTEHDHEHVYRHEHGADSDPGVEIADIVSWVPEIAADTNLSEQDWIPLDNAAQSLSARLHASGNELSESIFRQTIALCELIELSLVKIPDQLP